MAQGRRKWTAEEDARLREVVQTALEGSHPILWWEIAKSVPGRSNKDCRRRWYNSLARGFSKGSWTESEDERLWNAVRKHGKRWAQVAQEVRTRNSDQCSSHWSQKLNPDINFSDWTRQEDEALLQATEKLGMNWAIIAAKHVRSRTSLALRNRYNALRKRMSNNARPKPMVKPGNRRPTARRSPNLGSPNNDQLSSSPMVDGEDEEGEDEEGEDEEGEDEEGEDEESEDEEGEDEESEGEGDEHCDQNDLDEDGEPENSDENHALQTISLGEYLMEMHDMSSPSIALPEYPPYPAYHHSEFVSRPPLTTPLDGMLDLGRYHEHGSLNAIPSPPCPPTSSRLTVQDVEKFLNECHRYPLPDALASCSPAQAMLAADPCVRLPDPRSQVNPKDTNTAASSVSLQLPPSQGPVSLPLPTSESSDRLAQPLQHASIDVVCTPQQLSQIMGAMVGIASSVTVKLDSRNGRGQSSGRSGGSH